MKNFFNLQLFETDVEIIDRTGAESLIPEDRAAEIIQGAIAQSAVLSMGRRLANMTSKQTRLPVLDALPIAYFVNGDNGQKKTTKQAWDKKTIVAEEIAVIVPIPEAVLDDADYDIWGEVRPRIQEAFGKVIEGIEVVDQVCRVRTDYNDKPRIPQVMKKVTVETFGVEYPEPEKV